MRRPEFVVCSRLRPGAPYRDGGGAFTIELDTTAPADAEDCARQALADGGEVATVNRIDGLGPGCDPPRPRLRRRNLDRLLASRERIEAELLGSSTRCSSAWRNSREPGRHHLDRRTLLRARMTGSFSVYEAVTVGPRRLLAR